MYPYAWARTCKYICMYRHGDRMMGKAGKCEKWKENRRRKTTTRDRDGDRRTRVCPMRVRLNIVSKRTSLKNPYENRKTMKCFAHIINVNDYKQQ